MAQTLETGLTGPTAGALCALGSALVWTFITLIVRALSPYFSTITINVVRSAAGGLLLVAIALAWTGSGSLRELTPEGVHAYATIDAGPHVKVVCAPEDAARVEARLAPVAVRTILAHVGGPAVVEAA